jgi:SNF2 family DNA or RNA helicase
VVIVPEGKLLQWEEALTTFSKNINIVCLIGNSKSHGLIRTIEFNHNNGSPKFDVLLLSYEMFRKERERDYLLYYITHSAIYMCIDFEDPTFINSFHS